MLYIPLNPPELHPATHTAVATEIATAVMPGRALFPPSRPSPPGANALRNISAPLLAPPPVCRTGRRRAVAEAEACAVTRAAAAPRRPARRRPPRPVRSRRAGVRPAPC